MSVITIALIAGLTGMFGWGISDFFAKKTIKKIGEIRALAFSQFIGASLMVLYFFLTRPRIPTITSMNLIFLLLLHFKRLILSTEVNLFSWDFYI
jgi:hypothetical protein